MLDLGLGGNVQVLGLVFQGLVVDDVDRPGCIEFLPAVVVLFAHDVLNTGQTMCLQVLDELGEHPGIKHQCCDIMGGETRGDEVLDERRRDVGLVRLARKTSDAVYDDTTRGMEIAAGDTECVVPEGRVYG